RTECMPAIIVAPARLFNCRKLFPAVERACYRALATTALLMRVERDAPLEPRSGLPQEGDFLGRRCASEDRIAVRIAAEAANDRRMLLGPFQLIGISGFRTEPRIELERSLDHREMLRVLEGEVQEQPLVAIERRVATRVDDGDGGGKRPRVAGKSTRRVAKRVARELIEEHDAGKRVV